MTFWNKIIRLIKPSAARQDQYKEIRIPRQGKEDFVFYGRHLIGDNVHGDDFTLEFQLYAKQTGKIILEIKEQEKSGTDHAALEFPNTEEAIKYMTKISEDTQKDIKQIRAMMN